MTCLGKFPTFAMAEAEEKCIASFTVYYREGLLNQRSFTPEHSKNGLAVN